MERRVWKVLRREWTALKEGWAWGDLNRAWEWHAHHGEERKKKPTGMACGQDNCTAECLTLGPACFPKRVGVYAFSNDATGVRYLEPFGEMDLVEGDDGGLAMPPLERIFEHLYGYIKQHYAADNTETSKRKEEIKKKKAETKKKIEAIYNKKKFKDSGFVVLFGEAILRKNFAQRMLKTIADDKTKNNFKTLWKQYETLSDELFEADTKRTSFMDTLEAVREGIELIEENGMTMGVRKFDTIE